MRIKVLYGSIVAGGLVLIAACTGTAGALPDALIEWEPVGSSNERATSSAEGQTTSTEGASRSNEGATNSLESPPGARVGRSGQSSSSSSSSSGDNGGPPASFTAADCTGAYSCVQGGQTSSYTLSRSSSGCNISPLGVVAKDDGTVVDSKGTAVGSWTATKSSDGTVTVTISGQGTSLTCTRKGTTVNPKPPTTGTATPPPTSSGGTPVRDAG